MVNKELSLGNPTPWSRAVLDGLKRPFQMLMETLKMKKAGLGRVSFYEEC